MSDRLMTHEGDGPLRHTLPTVAPWQLCPVCAGKGNVPQGFYQAIGVTVYNSSGGIEQCRSCGGLGRVR